MPSSRAGRGKVALEIELLVDHQGEARGVDAEGAEDEPAMLGQLLAISPEHGRGYAGGHSTCTRTERGHTRKSTIEGVVGTCSYTVRDARIRPDAHGEGCLMCAVRESHLRLSSLNAQSAALVLTSLGSTAYTFRVACEKACSRIMS
jgi:hypothetical protein